ncbi:MAG: sarcosine oxidase subunit gamma [Woeseiaceae bacterium]
MAEIVCAKFGHINLRGNAADDLFTDGVAAALGQKLPVKPNTISRAMHRIYWLGPDEWHVVTALSNVDEVLQKLWRKLARQHVSINNVSGGQTIFQLSESKAPEVLAKGCTIDLHPSVFELGTCAQCGLAKAPVLLGYIDEAPVYEIIVRRSFSEYALRWLRQN